MTNLENQAEVIKISVSDNMELVIFKMDDMDATVNMSIENFCKASMEAGLISDYDMENGVVYVDKLEMRVDGSEEQLEDDLDVYDFANDMMLHEGKRVVNVFIKNGCYHKIGALSGLPF